MIVQNYQLIEEVGSGTFATVYKAQHRKTQEIFAIKKIKDGNNIQAVQNQIDHLKKIKHKNILNYETDFKFKNKWYIVFEYCGKGDLQSFKNKQKKLPQFLCRNLAFSLVQVLELLHSHKIVHRDLKLANILISDAYDFKLGDFGLSKNNEAGIMGTMCGTPATMAPQIMNRESYDEKCDTWALGVMIYELIYGNLPFLPSKNYGPGILGLANCVMNSQPSFDQKNQVGEDCKNFIRKCLIKNKYQRPTMSQLMQHSWLKHGGQSSIRKQYMNSLQCKSEVVERVNEVFHIAIAEHIIKLVQEWKLRECDIRINIQEFQKYYEKEDDVKGLIVKFLLKKVHELEDQQILVKIEEKQFRVKLRYVHAFLKHIEHIKQILSDFKINQKGPCLPKDLIVFVSNQATNIEDMVKEKLKLLSYVSELPIKKPLYSQIEINLNFNDETIHLKKNIHEYLDEIKLEEIVRSVNELQCEQRPKVHLFNHTFFDEAEKGQEVEVGELISHIIKFNSSQRK